MKSIGRQAMANPIFLSVAAMFLGSVCIYFANKGWVGQVLTEVIRNIGAAIITAGTFGIIFEYFGKINLINESVARAIGQSRSSSLGVTDFVGDVTSINHRELIKSSNEFIACSRYSSMFLDNHRKEIYERLSKEGRNVKFIKMMNIEKVPVGRGPKTTPNDFFKGICNKNANLLDKIELFETDRFLSYNFVKFDHGIWIKLYLNSDSFDNPPAFFVKKESELFKLYESDIKTLLSKSKKVEI